MLSALLAISLVGGGVFTHGPAGSSCYGGNYSSCYSVESTSCYSSCYGGSLPRSGCYGGAVTTPQSNFGGGCYGGAVTTPQSNFGGGCYGGAVTTPQSVTVTKVIPQPPEVRMREVTIQVPELVPQPPIIKQFEVPVEIERPVAMHSCGSASCESIGSCEAPRRGLNLPQLNLFRGGHGSRGSATFKMKERIRW